MNIIYRNSEQFVSKTSRPSRTKDNWSSIQDNSTLIETTPSLHIETVLPNSFFFFVVVCIIVEKFLFTYNITDLEQIDPILDNLSSSPEYLKWKNVFKYLGLIDWIEFNVVYLLQFLSDLCSVQNCSKYCNF